MTTTRIVLYNATILLRIGVLLVLFYFGFLYLAEITLQITLTEYLLTVHPSEEKVAKWILSVQGKYDSRYNDGRHIRKVTLSQCKITDEDIKQLIGLKKLRVLELVGTPITDSSIVYINQIHSIRELDLRNTQITLYGVKQIKLPVLYSLECIDKGLNNLLSDPLYDRSNLPSIFDPVPSSDNVEILQQEQDVND